MKGLDQRFVDLKERLSARADNQGTGLPRGAARPNRCDVVSECAGSLEPPAASSVRANEVRVTEPANGERAVLLAARPQIAAREAAEDGGSACVGPLPL